MALIWRGATPTTTKLEHRARCGGTIPQIGFIRYDEAEICRNLTVPYLEQTKIEHTRQRVEVGVQWFMDVWHKVRDMPKEMPRMKTEIDEIERQTWTREGEGTATTDNLWGRRCGTGWLL